jgi:hypothetical protein
LVCWPETTVPPSGITFSNGSLFVATLRSEALIRIGIRRSAGGGYDVTAIERWFAVGSTERPFASVWDLATVAERWIARAPLRDIASSLSQGLVDIAALDGARAPAGSAAGSCFQAAVIPTPVRAALVGDDAIIEHEITVRALLPRVPGVLFFGFVRPLEANAGCHRVITIAPILAHNGRAGGEGQGRDGKQARS